ncbi:Pyridoxal phosphate-dependent transferase, major domain [Sesbania bispinosa]|nr:Pyridoxal phosphate-dependent transferase, major domain [Sesbania bispinosa]
MATMRQVQCLMRRVCRGSRNYGVATQLNASSSSQTIIDKEYQHSAHNYHPIPIVFAQAKGSAVWDPEGNKYIDFLSGYSAVNQNDAQMIDGGRKAIAFYNDRFPLFAEYVTTMFGYDMVLPMNTGAEGVETAMKLARKWGYEKKRIPNNEALIVSCCGCFNGRTLGVISMSCDNEATRGFGPLMPGHLKVDFGDAEALERIFKEPIQGEAGVKIPPDGYLKAVRDLCSKYNVLMIADEIQTGLARTGKMLACEWEDVRPDVVILGKALGGGIIPVSAVLADKDVMLCIKPGQHGSTFGGNPLASAVAIASLQVIKDERLAERSAQMGEELLQQLHKIQQKHPNHVKEVRGRGLFVGVELNSESLSPVSGFELSEKLKERGVLAKSTHDTIIRFTPPLCISHDEIQEGSKALADVLEIDLPKLKKMKPKDATPPAAPSACDRCGRVVYG